MSVFPSGNHSVRFPTTAPGFPDILDVDSLMVPVREAGQYAGWIAPPKVGIDNKPGDFEYVHVD